MEQDLVQQTDRLLIPGDPAHAVQPGGGVVPQQQGGQRSDGQAGPWQITPFLLAFAVVLQNFYVKRAFKPSMPVGAARQYSMKPPS